MNQSNRRKSGFTLVELMIVVALIGILSVIAIPSFLNFQLKAQTSEGKINLAAIRTAEQVYHTEFGFYVSASASPSSNMQNAKTNFVNTDGANMGFDQLGWAPEGQVFFNYGVASTARGYTASAGADIDGDGTYQLWGYKRPNGGTDVQAKTLGASGTCAVANLAALTVGRCAPSFGTTVF